MILVIYTILCIIAGIFGFIYYACVVSSKCDRKEEEANEEINFISDNDFDSDFWNNK